MTFFYIRWLFPFIGHMGICTTAGVIRDFAGPYYVSVSYRLWLRINKKGFEHARKRHDVHLKFKWKTIDLKFFCCENYLFFFFLIQNGNFICQSQDYSFILCSLTFILRFELKSSKTCAKGRPCQLAVIASCCAWFTPSFSLFFGFILSFSYICIPKILN